MIRRDWFKRHVEILAQVAGTVLGLKKAGQVQQAEAEAARSFQQLFGMDGRLALALPFKDFLDFAFRGVKPSGEVLAALAAHFESWAGLLEAAGRADEAALARERAAQCRQLPP